MVLLSQGEFFVFCFLYFFFLVDEYTYLCHFYLIPGALLESLRKGTTDCWLLSVPGVWISWRNQVLETGRLWAGHCGGRPFIYSVWHTNLCGSRNNCWNWVRLLVALVGTFTLVEKGMCCSSCNFTGLLGRWRVGETITCIMTSIMTLCFCVQEP